MKNKQAFSITLKLVIQYIKLTNINSVMATDKQALIKALKFIMTELLCIDDFEQIHTESSIIQPLTTDMVDILMNSAVFY